MKRVQRRLLCGCVVSHILVRHVRRGNESCRNGFGFVDVSHALLRVCVCVCVFVCERETEYVCTCIMTYSCA